MELEGERVWQPRVGFARALESHAAGGGTRLGLTLGHLHEETRKRGTKQERRRVRGKVRVERWISKDSVQQPTHILDDGDHGDGGKPRWGDNHRAIVVDQRNAVERGERVRQLVHCEEAMATGEASPPNGMYDHGVVEERWNIGRKERTLNGVHSVGDPVPVEEIDVNWLFLMVVANTLTHQAMFTRPGRVTQSGSNGRPLAARLDANRRDSAGRRNAPMWARTDSNFLATAGQTLCARSAARQSSPCHPES